MHRRGRLGLLLVLSSLGLAQSPTAPAPVPSATDTNEQLGISFTYPASLTQRDPTKAAEAGHRAHTGQNGADDPEPSDHWSPTFGAPGAGRSD